MEIEQLRKELNHLLDNIVEHSKDFSNGRPIPSLEISFVLAKISKMQETMIVLRHLLQEQERGHKKESKRISNAEKVEAVSKKEAAIEIKEIELPIVEDIIPDDQPEKIKVTTPGKVKDIEKLPITKLMDALSLNDRYLYANELFHKDMAAFNELVRTIDNSTALSEVKELLSKYETEKGWDKENEHVISFNMLVERRFLS